MVTKEKNKWIESTVGQVMCIKNNFRKPISESERKKIQGEYPYYGPTKIQDYINEYTLDGRYVLIGEDGDHFLKYKDQSMTLLIDGKFNVNNHAHILQGTELCTTEWFYYYFQHKNIFNSLTRQGAGRYKLTKSALEKMKIKYPTIKEQEKIVEILSTWDSAIEKQEQLIKKKKEFKKGLMQRLLSGEVRFKNFKDDWKTYKVNNLTKQVINKNKDGNISLVLSVTNKKGFITQEEQFEKQVASKDLSNYKIVRKGEFAYNPSRINVGSIDLLTKFSEGLLSPMYIVFKCDEQLLSEYYNYWIKTNMFKKQMDKYLSGSVRETLSFEDMGLMKIKLPSMEEQKMIVDLLNNMNTEIELLEKELEALKLQKKGLMQRLLTGEVRVKV